MSLQPTSATKDLGGKNSLLLVCLPVPGHLVASDAGTAEAAVTVLAGGVVAAVGQGVCRVPAALQLTTLHYILIITWGPYTRRCRHTSCLCRSLCTRARPRSQRPCRSRTRRGRT